MPPIGFVPSAAAALWNQRWALKASLKRLERFAEIVGRAQDLNIYQYAQLFTFALEFSPDLILELGRGRGNSTCVWTEAAHQGVDRRVVSICLDDSWDRVTAALLRREVPPNWFQPLTVLTEDIRLVNYDTVLKDRQRILVFWDAHGYDVAEVVLGTILPRIAGRSHVVLMHDISDMRYLPERCRSYQGARLWRRNDFGGSTLVIGTMQSKVEQLVAILDFASRNGLVIHSADHSLRTELPRDGEKAQEIESMFAIPFLLEQAHWVWFSLNETQPSIGLVHYPSSTPQSSEWVKESNIKLLLRKDLERSWHSGRPTPKTILRIVAKYVLGYYK